MQELYKDKEIDSELLPLKQVLTRLKNEGKIHIAILFGSLASGKSHKRSDVDLAICLSRQDKNEEIKIIDEILMSIDRDINILRLDNEDESPFIIQEALKGIHLIEPDKDYLYDIASRALHETEGIKFRRSLIGKSKD